MEQRQRVYELDGSVLAREGLSSGLLEEVDEHNDRRALEVNALEHLHNGAFFESILKVQRSLQLAELREAAAERVSTLHEGSKLARRCVGGASLPPNTSPREELSYTLYGTKRETYCCSSISSPVMTNPDRDTSCSAI